MPDLAAEMRAAAVSLSQCGYNTALDIIVAQVPALVVPYAAHLSTPHGRDYLRIVAQLAPTFGAWREPGPGTGANLIATVDEVKAAAQAVKDLKAAFQMVMDERTRIEKLRKQIAGVVHDYAIDFDAARAEIGRRLACLRDAGGGG